MDIKDKKKVRKLMDEIVKKSFPLLKSKKIFICYYSFGPFSGNALWILPFWRVLFINKTHISTEEEVIPLIVHELCHFEIYQKRGWIKTLFLELMYGCSIEFRRKEEDEVDKRLIKKGYAKNLYKQRLSRWNSTPKDYKLKKIYLSPDGIKKYAKQIKKW